PAARRALASAGGTPPARPPAPPPRPARRAPAAGRPPAPPGRRPPPVVAARPPRGPAPPTEPRVHARGEPTTSSGVRAGAGRPAPRAAPPRPRPRRRVRARLAPAAPRRGGGARTGPLAILAASVLWGTTGTASTLAPAGAPPTAIGAAGLAAGGLLLFLTSR